MVKRFFRDTSGATLVYATIIMGVAIGLTGLSLDMSAYYLTRQQAQSAADAAALAAAYQLPNQALAIQAAQTAPVAVNEQQFSKNPGDVTIAQVNFFKTIPADDDDPLTDVAGPTEKARYVQVITSQLIQRPFLLAALGLGEDAFTAEAVATKGKAKCSTTPLWMCMPGSSWTGSSDPETWVGRQILVKYGPGSTSWAAGNYGLLADPDGNKGANALADLLGGTSGLDACLVGEEVDTATTATGVKNSLRNAFNVRFDVYEGNMNSKKSDPDFPPAENVTKGYFGTSGNPPCNQYDFTARDTRLPRDSNINPDAADPQFGNGDWDCAAYWAEAHPDIPTPPTGCTASNPTDPDGTPFTRYEMYYREITDAAYGGIPNTHSLTPQGDDGDTTNGSKCYGGTVPATPTDIAEREFDRRILTVAAVDCSAGVIHGSQDVHVEFFLSMFMTEAVTTPSEANLYLEVAGTSENGSEGIVPVNLNEWVELVR